MNGSTDRFILLILGAALLLATGGVVLLSLEDKEIPPSLVALASGALGALAAFLASRHPPRGH